MNNQIDFEVLKTAMFLCELCKDDKLAYNTAIDNYAFIAKLYIDKYGQELMNESHAIIKRMHE